MREREREERKRDASLNRTNLHKTITVGFPQVFKLHGEAVESKLVTILQNCYYKQYTNCSFVVELGLYR